MAGHSQFKNIMHRKNAQDAKRAKVFTRIIRELTVAARISTDETTNPRLRAAISAARAVNMPKDNVERVLKKAAGEDTADSYEEVRYEGYGPSGVAIIVEALTDNRNRTASCVRSTFSKFGGNLGDMNSVSFQFERVGLIKYGRHIGDFDSVCDAVIDAGADDIVAEGEQYIIRCEAKQFYAVQQALEKRFDVPVQAEIIWDPSICVDVPEDKRETLMKLLCTLDDIEDVQSISCNAEGME